MNFPPFSVKTSLLVTSLLVTNGCFSTLVFAKSENNLDIDVAAEAGYIDNFLYQANDEQSTAFYTVSSVLALESKSNQSAFNVDATVDTFIFQDFEDDDHTDFSLMPTYQFKFSQNQRLYMSAYWLNNYIYRGSGLSLGEAESLVEGDKKENNGAQIGFEYGNLDSLSRLSFEANYQQGEFTTRRAITRELDTEAIDLKSSFDYLISGKTYMAIDVSYRQVDYPNQPALNRDSLTGLVGIKWQTTVISELSFLVGYQNIKFENATLKDDDAFKWRFDYTWRPSDFTSVRLASDRKFDETDRLASTYRLAETYQVDISHAFTDQISLTALIGLNREEFITPDSQREEDYLNSALKLNYQRNDRLSFHLQYRYKSLDANYADIDYGYNNISMGVKVRL